MVDDGEIIVHTSWRFVISMYTDLQKASIWKRISAALLDVIFLSIVVAFFAMLLSSALGFDRYDAALDECYAKYETQYGISFDVTLEQFSTMSEEQAQPYVDAYDALATDPDAIYNMNMIIRLTMVIASISLLLGYLLFEFAVPLIFKNGQTIGKRVFGIGVMRAHGIRINTVSLFIRTVLGKFTIETMIPVLIILMIFWGTIGIVGPLVIFGIAILQVVLLVTSPSNSVIHDRLSDTVVVDMGSQMIFDTEDDLVEYTKRIHAEKASKQVY